MSVVKDSSCVADEPAPTSKIAGLTSRARMLTICSNDHCKLTQHTISMRRQGCSTLWNDEKSEQIVDAGEGGAVAVLAERAGAVGLEDVKGETAQAGKHAGIGAEGGE